MIINIINRTTNKLALFGAYVAAACIVLIGLIVLTEVILRNVFSTSTYMADELVGYLVAASTFFGMAFTFQTNEMIRVSIMESILRKRPMAHLAAEIICAALAVGVMIYLFIYMVDSMMRQWSRGYVSGTMSNMPQWIPTSLVVVGLFVLILTIINYILEIIFRRRYLSQYSKTSTEN